MQSPSRNHPAGCFVNLQHQPFNGLATLPITYHKISGPTINPRLPDYPLLLYQHSPFISLSQPLALISASRPDHHSHLSSVQPLDPAIHLNKTIPLSNSTVQKLLTEHHGIVNTPHLGGCLSAALSASFRYFSHSLI